MSSAHGPPTRRRGKMTASMQAGKDTPQKTQTAQTAILRRQVKWTTDRLRPALELSPKLTVVQAPKAGN